MRRHLALLSTFFREVEPKPRRPWTKYGFGEHGEDRDKSYRHPDCTHNARERIM
jgi:hypothetical protein